jgi:formate dehydrogenase major subunit/formate dehydrogenase alpha subunit
MVIAARFGELLRAAVQISDVGDGLDDDLPLDGEPDAEHAAAALGGLDFLVVQDIFLTETARLADVVLPSAASVEKEGTFTNTERMVQRSVRALDPPGQARSDAEIICDVAARMGHSMEHCSPSKVMKEIASLTPSYGGMTYSRLARGGLRWPCPDTRHRGTRILHAGEFTRGKGLFHPVEFIEPAEMPDEEYPLILTTGRILYHYHTGSMSHRAAALEDYAPEGWAELNPYDARSLGIRDGMPITVTSRRGVAKTRARLSKRSPKGVLFMSFHYGAEAVNRLTNPALDREGKIPEFKVCAVKVEAGVVD